MDVIALLLALLAVVFFALAANPRLAAHPPMWLPLGLLMLTAAWICQTVALTGTLLLLHRHPH